MYRNTRITPWFFVLHRVSHLRDAKAKDVADGLRISHSHAGVTLSRLKRWGFVRRQKDPGNTGGRPAFVYQVTYKGECFMDWADKYWGLGWYDFSAEEIAQLQTRDMDDPEYRARPSPQYDTRGWKEYYSYAMSEHRPG
jgi:DNA-binding MarR family transcriptional regulator